MTLFKTLYQKKRIKEERAKQQTITHEQHKPVISYLSSIVCSKQMLKSQRDKSILKAEHRFRKHCRIRNSEESKLEKITSKRKNNKCKKIPSGSNPHAGRCALRSWLADHSASRAQVQRKLTQIYTAPLVAIL